MGNVAILVVVAATSFTCSSTTAASIPNREGELNSSARRDRATFELFCPEGYRLEKINGETQCRMCNVCPVGQGVIELCTENSQTVCGNCSEGHSYSSVVSPVDACHVCDWCEIGVLEQCTPTSDTVCNHVCPAGTYWSSSLRCNPCRPPCGPNQMESIQCTNNQNRECIEKPSISDNITSTTTTTPEMPLEVSLERELPIKQHSTTTDYPYKYMDSTKVSLERELPIKQHSTTTDYLYKYMDSTKVAADLEDSELANTTNQSHTLNWNLLYSTVIPVVIFIVVIIGIIVAIIYRKRNKSKSGDFTVSYNQKSGAENLSIVDGATNNSTSQQPLLPESNGRSSPRLVTEQNLRDLAGILGGEWESLATRLGLSRADIYQCKANNPHNVHNQIFEMLCKCMCKQGNDANNDALCNVLREEENIDQLQYEFLEKP